MKDIVAFLLFFSAAVPMAEGQCSCPCPCTPIPTSTATAVPVNTPTTGVPSPGWASRAGSLTADTGNVVRVAADGTVFIGGFFTGTANFGSPVGSIPSAGMDAFVAKYTVEGLPVWVVHTGSPASNQARSIALDMQGNIYVVGEFQRTINWGCGVLTSALSDTYDVFIAKLSPAGSCLWSKSFGSGGDDSAYGVAVDGGNNVLMTGYFTGRTSFGGVPMFSSNNTGGASTFVAKYSPAGAFMWSKNFSPVQANNGPDVGYSIAVTDSDVLVAGEFQGMEYFDAVNGQQSVGMSPDAYLADFSTEGAFRWVKTIGAAGSDRAYSVAADHAGHAIITGYFAGTVDFGGTTVQSVGALNGYVASYAITPPLGALVWVRSILGSGVNYGQSVTVDSHNNTIVTGQFQGSADFGGTTVPSLGQSDIFISSYNPSGALSRVKNYGGTTADVGYGITTAPDDSIIGTGFFRNTMMVGTIQLQSAGSTDIYLLKQ